MSLFFYDGPISRSVAFENLLDNGEQFAERLVSAFTAQNDGDAQLVSVVTLEVEPEAAQKLIYSAHEGKLQLALRTPGDSATVVAFFAIAVILFPFGVGPEPQLLARIAAGVIWVTALLACCAVWGLGQVASKTTLTEVPPLLQAAARSLQRTPAPGISNSLTWLPIFTRRCAIGTTSS